MPMAEMGQPREKSGHFFYLSSRLSSDGLCSFSVGQETGGQKVSQLSGDGLDQEERLAIIRAFCRNMHLKHLTIDSRECHPFGPVKRLVYDDMLVVWTELMENLQGCTSLESIKFWDFPLLKLGVFCKVDVWIQLVVDMLSTSSLNCLEIHLEMKFLPQGYLTPLAKAIPNSSSVEILHVIARLETFGRESCIALMSALMLNPTSESLRMKSLKELRMTLEGFSIFVDEVERGKNNNIMDECMEYFITMLEVNRTLMTFQIPKFMCYSKRILRVLDALHNNAYVTNLIISSRVFPLHFDWTREVCDKLLSLVNNNFWLTRVQCEGIGLPKHTQDLLTTLLKKNIQISNTDTFVQPTSCRVFLCGFPKAGKTTIRKKMEYILQEKGKLFHPIYSMSKRAGISSKSTSKRTKGVEVVSSCVGSLKLSIWDMGGQDEFHAFHDLVIPNLSNTGSASLFVLTLAASQCKNTIKTEDDIKNEVLYWLRFLSSNTRTSANQKPHVIVVFTHVDYLPKSINIERYVEGLMKTVKDMFTKCFEFSSKEHFVTSHSIEMVEPFVECVVKEVHTGLAKLPHVYRSCVQMEEEIRKWRKAHPFETIIKWKDFVNMYQELKSKEVKFPRRDAKLLQEICETVASELNRGGHIIYFNDLKDVLVVDPNWFGTQVIGSLFSINPECLDVHTMEPVTNEKGYTNRDKLKSVLENSFNSGNKASKIALKKTPTRVLHVDIEDVINVMMKMNICYEEHSTKDMDQKGIFIPATLRDEDNCAHNGGRQLEWDVLASSSKQHIIYIGRRLQCVDPLRTFFSRGFFPRLQVVFEGKFGSSPTFRLEKNLVVFAENGMQVLVEHSGHVSSSNYMDGYIDIMVQSTKDSVKTLQFMKVTLIKLIEDLCSSPTFGCQGVTLSKSILRPDCVRELWLCMDRRDQSIEEDLLIEELFEKEEFEGYVHHWRRHRSNPRDQRGDEAQLLLGDEVWNEKVVNRRYANMMAVRMALKQQGGQIESAQDMKLSPHKQKEIFEETADPQHKVLNQVSFPQFGDSELEKLICMLRDQLIEAMDRKGDEVVDRLTKHIDKGLKDMRVDLLQEISESTNRVMNHFIRSQQRQVPSYVYVTTLDLEKCEWLISSLVPGLKSVQLHLMCEHKGKIHTVDGQKGIALRLESETLRAARPYVIWGLRIIAMLMKVSAQAAAGLGSMVPDLEKALLKGVASIIPNVSSDALGKDGTPSAQVNLLGSRDRPSESETRVAHQWLVNVLKGKDIQDLFGVQRVVYTNGSEPEFAWLCQRHIDEGYRTQILQLCPITASNED